MIYSSDWIHAFIYMINLDTLDSQKQDDFLKKVTEILMKCTYKVTYFFFYIILY